MTDLLIIAMLAAILATALYAARKAMWAARMAQKIDRKIDGTALQTTQHIEALDRLHRRLGLERGSLPVTGGWAASPDFLNILADRIMETKPQTIVECGSGVSTVVAARCLQMIGSGRIASLDHDARFAATTRAHLEELGLDHMADIQVAALTEQTIGGQPRLWYDQNAISLPESIDLIVVDGPPILLCGEEGRYPVGPVCFPHLSDHGAVLFDDTIRPGEKRLVERLLQEFPHLDRHDPLAVKGCVLLTPRS